MRINEGKSTSKPNTSIQEPGRLKRQQHQNQSTSEFEYDDNTNTTIPTVEGNVIGTSSGSHRLIECPFSVRGRPQIPTAIPNTDPYPVDEAQEWASEYAATMAHKARQAQDNDVDRMAEAAADLLAQMIVDQEEDEKLKNSKFVKYLRELSEGRFGDMKGPTEQQVELERADFDHWRQEYEESTMHLSTEEEREAWNDIVKDWHSHSANGLGYEGFAERQFHYEFMFTDPNQNPFCESQNLLEVADNLRLAGRLSQAILAYEAIVQQDPDNNLAWSRLGQLQVENEQDILAIAAFNRALDVGEEGEEEILVELIGCLLNEQCRAEAIQAIVKFLKLRGAMPDERVDPSLLVEECLRMVKTIDPNDTNTRIVMSFLHTLIGDIEESLKLLETIKTNNDHLQRVIINRQGAMHANLGNYATALRLYDRVIASRPESVRSYYNRGVALFNNGDYSSAISSFSTALSFQSTPSDGNGKMREDVRRGLEHVWKMLRLACEMVGDVELVVAARLRNLEPFVK